MKGVVAVCIYTAGIHNFGKYVPGVLGSIPPVREKGKTKIVPQFCKSWPGLVGESGSTPDTIPVGDDG